MNKTDIQHELTHLLILREASDQAQVAAARARQEFEEYADKLSRELRDYVESELPITFESGEFAVQLKGKYEPPGALPFRFTKFWRRL